MKYKILIIIVLYFEKMLFAQDTIRVETVIDTAFKTPQYIGVYDDVFLSHKETKWLLKADWMSVLKGEFETGLSGLGIEFERKIGKRFSLNMGLFADINILEKYFSSQELSLIIEPRWYVFANKQQAKGIAGNNLNGQYISVRAFLTKFLHSENVLGNLNYLEQQIFSINYGLQKRVYNNWYVNYRAGLGYTTRKNPRHGQWTWGEAKEFGFDTEFTLGLAFGGKKSNIKIEACDIFRCFEEENSLFKVDVSGLLQKIERNDIFSQIKMAYEKKINHSAWSLNSELRYYIRYSKSGSPTTGQFVSDIRKTIISLEPRYYYNLKKRMAQGKSANNLSGNYFSFAIGYQWGGENYQNIYDNSPFANDSYGYDTRIGTFAPKWGIQRRVFKHGFADFSIAPLQLNIGTYAKRSVFELGWDSFPIFDYKIGFAF
jgi:hypothetical protein